MTNTFRSITRLLPAAAERLQQIQQQHQAGGDNAPSLTDVLAVYVKFLRIRGIADRARRNVEEGLRYKVNDLNGSPKIDTLAFSHDGKGFVHIKHPYEMTHEEKQIITAFYDDNIQPKIPTLWDRYTENAEDILSNEIDFDSVDDLEDEGISIPEMTYGAESKGLKLIGKHGKNQAFDAPTFIGETEILVGQRPEGAWCMPGGFTEGQGKSKGFGELIEEVFTGAPHFCEASHQTGQNLNLIDKETFISLLSDHVTKTVNNPKAALFNTQLKDILRGLLPQLRDKSPSTDNVEILAELLQAIERERKVNHTVYNPLKDAVEQLAYQCKTTVFKETPAYKAWLTEWTQNTLNGKKRPVYADIRNGPVAVMETTPYASFYTKQQLVEKYHSLGFTHITGGDDIKSAKIAELRLVVNGAKDRYGVEHATFCDHPEIVMSMYRKGILASKINPENERVIGVVTSLIKESLSIYAGLAPRYEAALPYMPGETPVTPRRDVAAAADNTSAHTRDTTRPAAAASPEPAAPAIPSHTTADDLRPVPLGSPAPLSANTLAPIDNNSPLARILSEYRFLHTKAIRNTLDEDSAENEKRKQVVLGIGKALTGQTNDVTLEDVDPSAVNLQISSPPESQPTNQHTTPLNALRTYLATQPLEQSFFTTKTLGQTYPKFFSDKQRIADQIPADRPVPKGSIGVGMFGGRVNFREESFELSLQRICEAASEANAAALQLN